MVNFRQRCTTEICLTAASSTRSGVPYPFSLSLPTQLPTSSSLICPIVLSPSPLPFLAQSSLPISFHPLPHALSRSGTLLPPPKRLIPEWSSSYYPSKVPSFYTTTSPHPLPLSLLQPPSLLPSPISLSPLLPI